MAKKINIPFTYKDIPYHTHSPKIPLSDYVYIDVAISDIHKNEVYVVDTVLNIVLVYRLTNINVDDNNNILINIEFDDYLTIYYNFNDEKYIELANNIKKEVTTFFDKHKIVNGTYDNLDSPNHNIKTSLLFIGDNNVREKLKLIDIDELSIYFNLNLKMVKEHINNNTICDIEFIEHLLMDDDEIKAFTNFNINKFIKIFIEQTNFNVK